tara:strand:+ start:900 stop:1034 length:135 start_codon:yes stop_codon:yes gene_type:complete
LKKVKYQIEIKEHKVPFVLGLLKNMPFVEIKKIEEEINKELPKS